MVTEIENGLATKTFVLLPELSWAVLFKVAEFDIPNILAELPCSVEFIRNVVLPIRLPVLSGEFRFITDGLVDPMGLRFGDPVRLVNLTEFEFWLRLLVNTFVGGNVVFGALFSVFRTLFPVFTM